MIKTKQLFGLLFIASLFVVGVGYMTDWSDQGIAFAGGIGLLLILTALIMAPFINFVERRYGKVLAVGAAMVTVPLVARALYLTIFGWAWTKIFGAE